MSTDMDEKEARQLEKRIKREAPHLIVRVKPVIVVGKSKAWAVYINENGSNKLLLQIEKPSDWDDQKAPFLLP